LDVVVEQVKECRHIHDVPVLRLVGTDHHVSALSASKRGERSWGSTGSCPVESQSAGSGGGCVPVPRGAELRSCQVSEGALANWIQEAARARPDAAAAHGGAARPQGGTMWMRQRDVSKARLAWVSRPLHPPGDALPLASATRNRRRGMPSGVCRRIRGERSLSA
jgi:hypothetical protein